MLISNYKRFANEVLKKRIDILFHKMFSEFIITHSQAHESIFHSSSFHITHNDVRDPTNRILYCIFHFKKREQKDSAFGSNTKVKAKQHHFEKTTWKGI